MYTCVCLRVGDHILPHIVTTVIITTDFRSVIVPFWNLFSASLTGKYHILISTILFFIFPNYPSLKKNNQTWPLYFSEYHYRVSFIDALLNKSMICRVYLALESKHLKLLDSNSEMKLKSFNTILYSMSVLLKLDSANRHFRVKSINSAR